MAFGFRNFWNGIRIRPNQTTTQTAVGGDLDVDTTDGKLNYYNGVQTSSSPVLTENHPAPINNKTINGSNNVITNIPYSALPADVATTDTTQTFTNKSISGSTNTITNIPLAALPGDIATTDTAQTFTNKSISGLTNLFTNIPLSALPADTATTDTVQTFTNKSISGSTNTITNIPIGALPATVVTTTGTQTLTNKTIGDAPTFTQVTTPATPSSGFNKIYPKSDGNFYTLNSAGTEVKIGAGSGGINYISGNPDAESGTTGWATYANTAGSAPVTGTGGSPTHVTLTSSATNPLRGTKSFLFANSGSTSAQGEGASFDFTIDPADQATVLQIAFDYTISSGTFQASSTGQVSDVSIWIYDKTNSQVIQPAAYTLAGNQSSEYHFKGTFQTNSNSTSYRLIFHVGTTNTSAYNLKFDNVSVGPQVQLIGTPSSDFTLYTPTFGGFGSPSGITAAWRRVGDSCELIVNFTAGTVTGAAASVSLPTGLVVDPVKISNSGAGILVGNYGVGFNTGIYCTILAIGGTSTLLFGQGSNATSSLASALANAICNSGNQVSFRAMVPIQGWSTTALMSNDTDTRVVAMRAFKSTGTMSTGSFATVASWDATNYVDTHSAFSTSTGIYTVPVSGFYEVATQISSNVANQTLAVSLLQNGNQIYGQQQGASAAITGTVSLTGLLKCVAGDAISITAENFSAASAFSTTAAQTFVTIRRISGPSVIAPTETVACSYFNTSSPSVTGTPVQVAFDTILYDTHGAYNSSTGVFTAPVAGKYRVTSYVTTNTITYTGINNLQADLRKNGSSVFSPFYPQHFGSSLNTAPALMWSYSVQLLAGDTLTCFISNTISTTLVSGQSNSFFAVERFGN